MGTVKYKCLKINHKRLDGRFDGTCRLQMEMPIPSRSTILVGIPTVSRTLDDGCVDSSHSPEEDVLREIYRCVYSHGAAEVADCEVCMQSVRQVLVFALSIGLVCGAAGASESFDPSVPAPGSVLGFDVGRRPLLHGQIVSYFEILAGVSPRARLSDYGRTHEGRRLVVLTVSSPRNLERLDAVRAAIRTLGDPRGLSARRRDELARDTPAVAWLSFNVHGGELSGADAAVLLAHRLCAGTDARSRKLLGELVIHIDPVANPDGRARALSQLRWFSGEVPNPDPASVSHTGLWPWGRWNHYLFDPNRDYLGLVHPATRGRVEKVLSWWPQLVVDAHEMGADSTFLFSPPRHPYNPHLPAHVKSWMNRFSADQAGAFDARGWSYYTRSWNEEFYPGYGSGWARYLGAVGILFEQAATSGTLVRQRTGTILHFGEAVEHHLEGALANLETLAVNRREILLGWSRSRARAVEQGRRGRVRAHLLPAGRRPLRLARLVDTLVRHGIEVHTNPEPVRAGSLHDAWSRGVRRARLPAASYLVRMDQPLAPLAHNLLDFHQPMDREFLREERTWLERRGRSRLYETTAWSLPLLFGVESYWTDRIPAGDWRRLEAPVERGHQVDPAEGRYGYLLAGQSDASLMLVAGLLQAGATVRVGREPVTLGGRAYGRGAFLLRTAENPGDLRQRVASLARRFGVEVVPLAGARAGAGPDLGGDEFRPLTVPRIAVLAGYPVSPPSYGAVWHLLDKRLGLRFSGLDVALLGHTDLARYNVLVVPHCWWGAETLAGVLGEKGIEKIKTWIEAGGTAVGVGSGAWLLADEAHGLTKARPRKQVLDRFPPVVLGLDAETARRAGRLEGTGLRPTPGHGENEGDKKSQRPGPVHYPTPYDVPPVIGPGARSTLPPGSFAFRVPKTLVRLDKWLEPVAPVVDKPQDLAPWLERADQRLRRFQPRGALLRVDLDPDLWLAYGAGERIAAHFGADDVLVAAPPVQVAGRFGGLDSLHVSGLLWPEALGRIAHTAYLAREKVGRGQVILFADDPVHRGVSWATARLFLNAVVLGPGLGTDWSRPW